jgi:hypothetical protein
MSAPVFKVFTGPMETYTKSVEGVERKFIKTTASSTVEDRKGHEFSVEALKKMGTAANGMTIFLNHEYRVPEDLFGTVVDADAKHAGFDSEKNAVWDLDLDVMVNDANPRAVQAWDAYENGVRMGVSVGVIVKEWDPKPRKGIQRILDVDLLEASIVGIPANPRTWVQGAVKSINAYQAAADEGLFETLDLIDAQAEVEGMKKDATTAEEAEAAEEATEGEEHEEEESSAPIDPENDDSLSPEEEAKSDEPEETSETDADEAADDSDPEAPADGATPDAPDDEAESHPEASVSAGIDMLVNAYKSQVQELNDQLATVTKERDEALEASRIALSIVERISALPLGRKATYQREIKSFRRDLSGVYGDDFIAFLEREHK